MTYFFNGGREEAWPGEERILVPSPRDVPSYDLKPADVGRRASPTGFCDADRRRLRVRRRQLREPGHGRPHRRRSRRSSRRSRRPTAASAGSSSAVERARRRLPRSPPTTATPRRCSRTTASAPHRAHDEPGAADRHGARRWSSGTAARSPISRRLCSTCSACESRPR